MSWFSDWTGINVDIAKPIQNALNPINLAPEGSEARRFIQGIQGINQGATDFVWKGPEAAVNAIAGRWDDANTSLKKFAGGALSVNATMTNPFLQAASNTHTGNAILRNPTVSKYTLGLSDDFAGLSRAGRSLQSGNLSDADRDSVIRWFSKGATAAAVAAVIPSLSKGETFGSQADKIYTGGSAAARGDYAGAIGIIGEIPGVSDWLPKRPDWLPNIDFTPGSPNPPGTVGSRPPYPATTETSPWEWGGPVDSGIPASKGGTSSGLVWVAAAIGIAFLLRRRGVI